MYIPNRGQCLSMRWCSAAVARIASIGIHCQLPLSRTKPSLSPPFTYIRPPGASIAKQPPTPRLAPFISSLTSRALCLLCACCPRRENRPTPSLLRASSAASPPGLQPVDASRWQQTALYSPFAAAKRCSLGGCTRAPGTAGVLASRGGGGGQFRLPVVHP